MQAWRGQVWHRHRRDRVSTDRHVIHPFPPCIYLLQFFPCLPRDVSFGSRARCHVPLLALSPLSCFHTVVCRLSRLFFNTGRDYDLPPSRMHASRRRAMSASRSRWRTQRMAGLGPLAWQEVEKKAAGATQQRLQRMGMSKVGRTCQGRGERHNALELRDKSDPTSARRGRSRPW